MTEPQRAAISLLISHACAVALGIFIGWKLYQPDVVVETPKPEVRQADGSVILERDHDAKPATPQPKLPAGKHERTTVVTVKPKPQPKPEPVKPGPDGFCPVAKECPALTVRLDLVQQEDGRRVIASSPDGEIVGGIDVPLEPMIMPKPTPWAAGITYGRDRGGKEAVGAFVDRDAGPFRVGIEADQESARVRVGMRF